LQSVEDPQQPQAESGDLLFERLLYNSASVFGRLVRGASLRSPEIVGTLQCQTAHLKTFRLWLDLPQREQRADLRRYLSGADSAGVLPQARQHCESPAALVPDSASPHERELFLKDLRLVSASMENDGRALDVQPQPRGLFAALWHWKPKWRTTGQEIN
jgi:hypothetical protein